MWEVVDELPEEVSNVPTQMANPAEDAGYQQALSFSEHKKVDYDELNARLDKAAKNIAELTDEKQKIQEDIFKFLQSKPSANTEAMPAGERPTGYNARTGKFEEITPERAAQLGVPLGRPRTTGEHAPEGGVIFSHEPWVDFGAQATPVQDTLQRFASNEPGIPAGYKPPEDRINVPELDLGPHNTQVLDAPPARTDQEIPIFDPSEAKLI